MRSRIFCALIIGFGASSLAAGNDLRSGNHRVVSSAAYFTTLVNVATSEAIKSHNISTALSLGEVGSSQSITEESLKAHAPLLFTFGRSDSDKALLFVDNVGLNAVPEPSSVFLSGLASLLLLRRRR